MWFNNQESDVLSLSKTTLRGKEIMYTSQIVVDQPSLVATNDTYDRDL